MAVERTWPFCFTSSIRNTMCQTIRDHSEHIVVIRKGYTGYEKKEQKRNGTEMLVVLARYQHLSSLHQLAFQSLVLEPLTPIDPRAAAGDCNWMDACSSTRIYRG